MPDPKEVVDDTTTNLIYQEKQIRGILSRQDYTDSDDGVGALAKPNALAYVAQGGTLVGEAYVSKNCWIAKIREREERRKRAKRIQIQMGRTALEDFQLSYDSYKGYKWHVRKTSRPTRHEESLPIVE